jgi:short-subunit dehydrogenase
MSFFRKMPSVKGEWAVITGAASGIGLEFARRFASMGANIVIPDISEQNMINAAKELTAEYGVEVKTILINLASHDAPTEVMARLKSYGISPLILINNAGIFSFDKVAETDATRIDLFIDLHIRTLTHLSRLMAIDMASRKRGYILNMSSMSCWMPMPGIALYSATKAYIRVFTRALSYEMRDDGVSIMVACPGGIATSLFGLPDNLKRLALRLGAITTPQRFVKSAVRQLLLRRKQYINGITNRIAIFFVAIQPTAVRMLIKRLMLDKGITKK